MGFCKQPTEIKFLINRNQTATPNTELCVCARARARVCVLRGERIVDRPVSYTHLDVYKRQPVHMLKQN